jgi:hypothetical protein
MVIIRWATTVVCAAALSAGLTGCIKPGSGGFCHDGATVQLPLLPLGVPVQLDLPDIKQVGPWNTAENFEGFTSTDGKCNGTPKPITVFKVSAPASGYGDIDDDAVRDRCMSFDPALSGDPSILPTVLTYPLLGTPHVAFCLEP